MHKRNRNKNSTRNHNTGYNVVHPQCRGYVHKLCSIQLATKTQFDLHTQLQILSVLKKSRTQQQAPAHTAAGFFLTIFFTKPSAHTAAEVVHAHSWDLTFPYKINLSFAFISYIKKPNFSYLQKGLFIRHAIIKPWLQTMGTQNPKPWI